VKQLEVREGADEETSTRLVPMMRECTVFNIDQREGLPDSVKAGKPLRVRNPDTATNLLTNSCAQLARTCGKATVRHFTCQAETLSQCRHSKPFKGADHFYNVAFHELTHWSAHKSRLDRDLKNRFDSRNYGAKELIAELGAAFLCAEFGFDGDLRHAGYVAHRIELLKADKRAFFTACSQASKAAEFLRGLALAEPTEAAA
jgi:antirestriction protein ArdC